MRRGEIDTRIANAVGYLAGICLKAFEQGEIEQRLAALEMIVNGQPSESRTQSEQDGSAEQFVFEAGDRRDRGDHWRLQHRERSLQRSTD
ncbi:MAG: hypothetical protein ACHQJD_00340 [Thermoanaerobaculia bacterium]